MIVRNKYILPNPDKKKLKDNKFRYHKLMSDADNEFYHLRFPIMKYMGSTTVDGDIAVNTKTGEIKLNVYNYGTNYTYPPFYKLECSPVYEQIIKRINIGFKNMFSILGIEVVS